MNCFKLFPDGTHFNMGRISLIFCSSQQNFWKILLCYNLHRTSVVISKANDMRTVSDVYYTRQHFRYSYFKFVGGFVSYTITPTHSSRTNRLKNAGWQEKNHSRQKQINILRTSPEKYSWKISFSRIFRPRSLVRRRASSDAH